MAGSEGVKSVRRALDLLILLGASDDGLRVSELARQAELAVSTTHRLLTTLESQGFAQSDPETAVWRVGRTAFTVGQAYGRRRSFIAPALPYLKRLRDQTQETANFGILDGDWLVTVSQVESRQIVRAISPPGGHTPVFCSGMGKALLATWPDPEIIALAARTGLRPMTPRSLTSIEAVLADIARIRRRGYAVDDEEHIQGLRCVAAVVWSPTGEPACAISISGLAARLAPERLEITGTQVRDAAHQLTEHLGGQAPDLFARKT
ncbi:IclR family transcriptional regulator [Oceanicola sp. S124]|uniref:IclR family transcriptional regulator n=1 Tax=Oceanicola sp. S124 TaxID=1042378 RepID=UPI00110FDBA2|nr:IclR family transcriptional regulator [Oceanicola sp. S124]